MFSVIHAAFLVDRHVMMKRLEDLADSPLVPSLLVKIHLEADKELMHVCEAHFHTSHRLRYYMFTIPNSPLWVSTYHTDSAEIHSTNSTTSIATA